MPGLTKELVIDSNYIRSHGRDHIDWSDLWERLFEDSDFVEQMAAVFLEDNCQRVNDLESVVANSDFEEIKRLAHAMKGSSLTVSAIKLADIALNMENAAKSADPVSLESLLAEAQSEMFIVKSIMSYPGWIDAFQSSDS